MSNTPLPPKFDLETISQLPKEELVSIIVQQQRVIEQFKQEIERLKAQQNTDSQTSSKPPSTDLLKKSEKPKASTETTESGTPLAWRSTGASWKDPLSCLAE